LHYLVIVNIFPVVYLPEATVCQFMLIYPETTLTQYMRTLLCVHKYISKDRVGTQQCTNPLNSKG